MSTEYKAEFIKTEFSNSLGVVIKKKKLDKSKPKRSAERENKNVW